MCSTPVGINGFNTGDLAGTFDPPDLCSTPVGINGFNTSVVDSLY